MPRRFFRKFAIKRDKLRAQWYLSPFEHLLHDPNLWGIRRRTVVPAFSLGIFVACLPFPGHMVTAALLALVLRINIPVAAVSTWVINPLVMGPLYYLAYQLGSILLRYREGKAFCGVQAKIVAVTLDHDVEEIHGRATDEARYEDIPRALV